MSQETTDQLKEVGIDYITATSTTATFSAGLGKLGTEIVRDEVRRGNRRRDSRANGYKGLSTSHCFVGARYDGVIVRASGPVARREWKNIAGLARNITRLDVQFTAVTCVAPALRLKALWLAAMRKAREERRVLRVKGISGQEGLQTLLLGARSSERYLRCYDKGVESGEPRYQGCVRSEAELKGDQAKVMTSYLAQAEDPETEIVIYLLAFVKQKLNYSWPLSSRKQIACIGKQQYRCLPTACDCRDSSKEVQRSLVFLNTCVRPLLHRLVKAGYEFQVAQALGLEQDVIRLRGLGPSGPVNTK